MVNPTELVPYVIAPIVPVLRNGLYTPEDPCGPVGPVLPIAPVAPVFEAKPDVPVGPVKPVCPCATKSLQEVSTFGAVLLLTALTQIYAEPL